MSFLWGIHQTVFGVQAHVKIQFSQINGKAAFGKRHQNLILFCCVAEGDQYEMIIAFSEFMNIFAARFNQKKSGLNEINKYQAILCEKSIKRPLYSKRAFVQETFATVGIFSLYACSCSNWRALESKSSIEESISCEGKPLKWRTHK